MTTATASQRASGALRPHDITSQDIEYLRVDGAPLLLRLHRPGGKGPFPLMIDLHGGAWCSGDRHNDVRINEALARSGIMVAALDFRMPPVAAYPGSLADINYAVRWLKHNAGRLGGKGTQVGAIGISSGGHQAMLAALRPADPRYLGHALKEAPDIDATLACVVLCWPVIDPAARYRYARRMQASGGKYPEQLDRVIPSHDRFWGDEAAMEEGNPVAALERGEGKALPPVLYVQGEDDLVHPRADLDRFVAAYRKRGGRVDLALYPGEVEGFINRNPDAPAAGQALERIVGFVRGALA